MVLQMKNQNLRKDKWVPLKNQNLWAVELGVQMKFESKATGLNI